MSIRNHAPRRGTARLSGSLLLSGIAIASMGMTTSAMAAGGEQVDSVFANSFEPALDSVDDILLKTIATTDASCPQTGRNEIDIRPGASVRFCYRLENHSDVTLDRQEISSSTYGLIYQGAMSIPPGESVVIEDPGSPRIFQHRAIDLVYWQTRGAGRYGDEDRVVYVNVAPDIALYRFLTTDLARCPEGIAVRGAVSMPAVSGYTALTVAPGQLVTHCFRARNTSISEDTSTLTDNLLTDSLFGQLLDSDQSFINAEVYTVAAQDTATTSAEPEAQWSASDGVDTVFAEAQSSLYVTANPACDGIRQSSSYDYVHDFYSIQTLADIRLDFNVTASPAKAGESMTVDAHGAISALFPANTFGPRLDTRVYLPVPAGIDLNRPLQAQASINGGVPISANLDVPGRMLVLSTGPVAGAPAEIDLHVSGYIDAAQTQPVSWTAPKLQLDIVGDTGAYVTMEILPDPLGPPVLETPMCVSP